MSRRRRDRDEQAEERELLEQWRKEQGSDASLSLRAKIRLWVERAREHGAR